MEATLVERDEVAVLFVPSEDRGAEIAAAWDRLESQLPSLRGRRFFGAFYPVSSEYRACVQVGAGDDATALGLRAGVLPGGPYLRARLRGEPPGVYGRIAPTFAELARSADSDDTRPSLEFYRRRNEIDLLLPVLGP